VWCHKNSWIYLTSTYYWWLLRPSITIRFEISNNSSTIRFDSKWKKNTIRTALHFVNFSYIFFRKKCLAPKVDWAHTPSPMVVSTNTSVCHMQTRIHTSYDDSELSPLMLNCQLSMFCDQLLQHLQNNTHLGACFHICFIQTMLVNNLKTITVLKHSVETTQD